MASKTATWEAPATTTTTTTAIVGRVFWENSDRPGAAKSAACRPGRSTATSKADYNTAARRPDRIRGETASARIRG